jgi:hypothetical protein
MEKKERVQSKQNGPTTIPLILFLSSMIMHRLIHLSLQAHVCTLYPYEHSWDTKLMDRFHQGELTKLTMLVDCTSSYVRYFTLIHLGCVWIVARTCRQFGVPHRRGCCLFDA